MNEKGIFFKIEALKEYMNFKDIISLLISFLGILISNIQLIEYIKVEKGNDVKIILYNFIICGVIIAIDVYYFIIKNEASKIAKDKLELEEKNKNLLEITDNIRCFKHDFNNIIQAIDGYLYLEDMKSLQVYFKSLFNECNHVKSVEILNCKNLDNPAIFGVLINKYRIAVEKNIQMNIDILTSLKELNGRSYVVSRMLGILLDNAIEATSECSEKIINVELIKEPKKNRCVIRVENTYQNKDIDTTRIFEKNYTTKKEKGNTGLGLWKIQDILKKDSSLDLFTSKDDNMFKQQLEIYELKD